MTVTAIVLAAGSGRRFGEKKQFSDLAGRPLLIHSLSIFQKSPCIDKVICVAPREDLSRVETLADKYALSKIKKITPGGTERQDSAAVAIFDLEKEHSPNDIVLIHDGARPFVSLALVDALVQKTMIHGAVVAARRITDSLKEVSAEGFIQRSVPRKGLWAMQTPQSFRLPILAEAYRKGMASGVTATDDAMLVEQLGHPILCVEGPAENIKITAASDLKWAELWLRHDTEARVLS